MGAGFTDATFQVINEGIEFQAIKSNTLRADFEFGEQRPYFGVKTVFVHPQIKRCISDADNSWKDVIEVFRCFY